MGNLGRKGVGLTGWLAAVQIRDKRVIFAQQWSDSLLDHLKDSIVPCVV